MEDRSKSMNSAISTTSSTAGLLESSRMDRVYSRISSRLMPIFILVVLCNQIDRQNINYAALTMNRDLGFSSSVYGLGSALFFITMCVCQIPSNIILLRVGVPRWLGFLVFSWGAVATASALIHDATSFYVLRLLLGVFESGAAPAMWYAVSQFYPTERMTRPYFWITSGVLLSALLGPPLAAAFLSMDGLAGLHGWQWLFILEGIPSVLLGIALALFLPETPLASKWLNEEEKALFKQDMQRSEATSPPRHLTPANPLKLFKPVLTNPLLPLAVFAGFAINMAAHAFLFFSAIIVSALLKGKAGLTNVATAAAAGSLELKPVLLLSIPSALAAVLAFVVAVHSQRRDEVFLHSSIPLMIAGAVYMAFPPLGAVSVGAGFVAMIVFASCVAAANGPLMSVVTRVCEGPSQAIGMPYFNSISMLGGFLGPYLTGIFLQRPNGITKLCLIIGAFMVAAGGAILLLRHLTIRRDRRRAAQQGAGGPGCISAGNSLAFDSKDIEAPTGILRAKDSGADLGVEMAHGRHGNPASLQHRTDGMKHMLPGRE